MRERRRIPAEFRDVSFPFSVRGYDRRAVDFYIAGVNRLIAELEATHSPEAAIRHALAQAEEQTRGSLQRARETSEEIIAVAWENAEEIVARAKAEAVDIVVNASAEADSTKAEADENVARATMEAERILARSRKEAEERLRRAREEVAAVREEAAARLRELRTDTEAVWAQRRELLDDIRELAARLATAASSSAARLPPGERVEPAEERVPESDSEREDERGAVTATAAPRESNASPPRPDDRTAEEKGEAATGPDRSAS